MKNIILHVLNTNEYSGAENVVCQIIKMYKSDTRYQMVYCSLDGPIRQILEKEKIQFVALKKMSVSELRKAINKVKPTVIHAHDMRASFFVSLSCGKIPFISHIHNNGFDSRSLNIKVLLFRIAAQRAKHIFWVSKAAKEGYYYQKQIGYKSSILYNVVDCEEIRKKANVRMCKIKYDIVFLGRISYEKNPLRLIDIISRVAKKNQGIRVAIIGKGPLENEVNKRIIELGLSKNIDMLGFQTNPYPTLKNAKIMIMTSLWEGLPMCALEAIALGIPIVSTPTDGLCELVLEGKTGFLAAADDELADKINLICTNSDLLDEMHFAVLKQAEKLLDINKYKAELSAVYE